MNSIASHSNDGKIIEQTVTFVLKVNRRIRAVLFLIIPLLMILLVSFIRVLDTTRPGNFHLSAVSRDIIVTLNIYLLTLFAWYVNSVSVAPIVSEEYFPWCTRVFYWWDKMNTRLIPDNDNYEALQLKNNTTVASSSAKFISFN